MPAINPKRRLLRFSLRSILIATALAGVFLGWVAHEMRRGHEIEMAIEEVHLKNVAYESPVPEWMRPALGQYFLATIQGHDDGPVESDNNVTLAHVDRLKLFRLRFVRSRISDTAVTHLKGMMSLKCLELHDSNITYQSV